ncbi:MAG: hypothetical protein ACP5IA_09925 [Sediminispirochaetaceae bacterium]
MKTKNTDRKSPVEIKNRRRREILPLLIAGAVIMMILESCYAPISLSEQGFSMDVTMESRDLPDGDTVVLAGLLINSGFEETLKDVTQLTVAIDSPASTSEMEDKLEEILINVALGGTTKFSGNPYFAIEVLKESGKADFTVTGVPANKDYFLYMGGFNSIDQVKQFFGLMEEEEGSIDDVYYSHIFYLEGPAGATVTVPFDVEGVTSPVAFEVTTAGMYEGPGWYFVEPWDYSTGINSTIVAPAGQPFSVEPGRTTRVQVFLTDDSP